MNPHASYTISVWLPKNQPERGPLAQVRRHGQDAALRAASLLLDTNPHADRVSLFDEFSGQITLCYRNEEV